MSEEKQTNQEEAPASEAPADVADSVSIETAAGSEAVVASESVAEPVPVDVDITQLQQATLKQKESESKDWQDQYLRLLAEFDNYKKRMDKEKINMVHHASERVIKEILAILDSLDRAESSFEKSHSAEDVFTGLQLIQKQFQDVLTGLGVKKIECKGCAFDPHWHDALMQKECDDIPENTIVEVCKNGYVYQDKVIRHAQVVIAKKTDVKLVSMEGSADDSKD